MIDQALQNLRPGSQWLINNDVITWRSEDQTQPTPEEIDAEVSKLQAEYDTQEYARNRKEEYYALNQFELISDDDANGTSTHKDAIAAIKTKWPKDNSGPK